MINKDTHIYNEMVDLYKKTKSIQKEININIDSLKNEIKTINDIVTTSKKRGVIKVKDIEDRLMKLEQKASIVGGGTFGGNTDTSSTDTTSLIDKINNKEIDIFEIKPIANKSFKR
ncbi:MAG: hypothetical protein U9N59_06190 [Campylobacterota bacterium]|nr:hypothetical protein [Campylobacterota bacterium]